MQRASAHAGADPYEVLERLKPIAARFADERVERQRRRELVQADFDELCSAGYLLCVVPTDQGGTWRDAQHSMRPICEMLRTLAHGDPSVALVASMHPAVILTGDWLTAPEAPAPYADVWEQQCRWVFQTACDGHWWGTIMSEPGSGGDTAKTRAVARRGPSDGEYLVSG